VVVGGTSVVVVVVGGTVVAVVVAGGAVVVVVTDLPSSPTMMLVDAFTLPLTVSSENLNRFARAVVFLGNFATRCNLAAHFTDASNPLTFGLEVHAQVFAFLTVARIVTDPPAALSEDSLAVTVTGLVTALAGRVPRPARTRETPAMATAIRVPDGLFVIGNSGPTSRDRTL
jgi:hypothetical protein